MTKSANDIGRELTEQYVRVIFHKNYAMILYCLLYAHEMNVNITKPKTMVLLDS